MSKGSRRLHRSSYAQTTLPHVYKRIICSDVTICETIKQKRKKKFKLNTFIVDLIKFVCGKVPIIR